MNFVGFWGEAGGSESENSNLYTLNTVFRDIKKHKHQNPNTNTVPKGMSVPFFFKKGG